MPSARSDSTDFTVLLVCTGNICRSALGERLGNAFLADTLGAESGRVRLVSAGTQAVVGSAMHPQSALVLGGLGAEAGDFRARQLHAAQVAEADLVLTMTRAHRRSVLEESPRSLAKTFTLLEASDLLERLTLAVPEGGRAAERARALVAAMAATRSRRQAGDADDIADPIGRPVEAHQEAGDAIASALLPVLARFAALVAESPSPDAVMETRAVA